MGSRRMGMLEQRVAKLEGKVNVLLVLNGMSVVLAAMGFIAASA